jgi:Homeodomain-like domain
MCRWRKRYEEQGYKGLLDRRRRKPSSRRVPKEQAKEVLSLYRDKYFDLNVRHFHEKLGEEHQIGLSKGRPGVDFKTTSMGRVASALPTAHGNSLTCSHPSPIRVNRKRSCSRSAPLIQNSMRSG